MKTGRSLQALAAELERQAQVRKDYLAPQGQIVAKVIDAKNEAGVAGKQVVLDGFNGQHVGLKSLAHQQLADHLGVPRRYYDRMIEEQPHLLVENINTWLHAEPDAQRRSSGRWTTSNWPTRCCPR
jgi:hypothetical protein